MTTNYYQAVTSKKKIDSLLIIEKDDLQRKGLTVALMDYFNEIRSTDNPVEALHQSASKKFDVIISDYHFDIITGKELINKLIKYNSESRFFVFTVNLNDQCRNELKELGIDNVFEKPIDIKSLINKIVQTT
jgi:response regulator RpfG family c-di-GMP phosphodiesterase